MKRFWFAAFGLGLFFAASSLRAQASGPYQFYGITPCRVVDTRTMNPPSLTAATQRDFAIIGSCGVPSTAKAAAFNVTMISPTVDGFLKIWPYGTTRPTTSNINATAGTSAIANMAVVLLTAGTNNISLVYGTAGGGTCDVAIDVTGYYQ
jgi:hypothetical protein